MSYEGHRHSRAAKRKISDAMRGRTFSAEHRAKLKVSQQRRRAREREGALGITRELRRLERRIMKLRSMLDRLEPDSSGQEETVRTSSAPAWSEPPPTPGVASPVQHEEVAEGGGTDMRGDVRVSDR